MCYSVLQVNLLVSKKVSHCPNLDMDQMSQMSEYKSTLRMPHLFFFPGIAGMYDNANNSNSMINSGNNMNINNNGNNLNINGSTMNSMNNNL